MFNTQRIVVVAGALFFILLSFQNCSNQQFSQFELSSEVPKLQCRETTAEELKPKLKWDWFASLDKTTPGNFANFSQVMATPVVRDLNNDGIPEVVFTTWSLEPTDRAPGLSLTIAAYGINGVLRIVDGQTGRTLKSIGDLAIAPMATGNPGLVDVDGDGLFEIVYIHYSGTKIIALNHDGSLRWAFGPVKVGTSAEVSSFLDPATGQRRILADNLILKENASKVAELVATAGAAGSSTQFAFPLKNASDLSIVRSTGVYASTGALKFNLPYWGYSAAADVDEMRPGFEVVGSGGGRLWMVDSTGQLLFDRDLKANNSLLCPGGSVGGGPPTIGDFDGDPSSVEIAMATGRYLTVFNSQGVLIDQAVTQDCSSLATGISSFDFNGDKKPEIIYADEEYLRIFEFRGGKLTEVHREVNPSGTLLEYPVVVDVDGNGSSELVVASNNYAVGGFYQESGEVGDGLRALNVTGVRAFESSNQAWMQTRATWPQSSYSPLMDASASELTKIFNGYLGKTFRRNSQLSEYEAECVP